MFVLDTNSFHVLGNYYPEVFPTLWERIEDEVAAGVISSCREVRKELEVQNTIDHIEQWADEHAALFPTPSEDEMAFVAEILGIPHFRQIIPERARLRGYPVADPFLIARARTLGASVVTEEALKPNAAKVPNVCQHFGIDHVDVRALLPRIGLRF